jgi:hypothetical protein
MESSVRITAFHHPTVCRLIEALERDGVDGLYRLENQFPLGTSTASREELVANQYNFTAAVRADGRPHDDLEFRIDRPFGEYNWEVFFHIPFWIANALNADQQYAEAQRWYHTIFNPTVGAFRHPVTGAAVSSTQRFWRFRPFFEAEGGERVERILARLLTTTPTTPGESATDRSRSERLREIEGEVRAWLRRPFDPHAIAHSRWRAYQIAIALKYIDNLLDWGDYLFQQDTRESIAEAAQLYVLAREILGPRPRSLSAPSPSPRTLDQALNDSSARRGHLLARLEGQTRTLGALWEDSRHDPAVFDILAMPLFFCFPANDHVLTYWNRVDDRLFKIRHCLNFDGERRELPLFEPPIDPGLLVRAAAAGVGIGEVLRGGAAQLATFRFQSLLQRAIEFTGDVRSLAGQLLAALEKKDAEALSLLRARHERTVLENARRVRELQLNEARETRKGLDFSRSLAETRLRYYESLAWMSPLEATVLTLNTTSSVLQTVSQALSSASGGAAAAPTGIGGAAGPMPVALAMYGGETISRSIDGGSRAVAMAASIVQTVAAGVGTLASYERRWEEWQFQKRLAQAEIAQIDQQIVAADVRVSIAERELANHDTQVEHAREVEDFLKEQKFTTRDLYDWMVREVGRLHFASYQMAYDLAQRAERAYRFERLVEDDSPRFIQFGRWDNLRKGLLAGEWLHNDLRRMEKAYLDSDRREYELTKHISLALHDPLALLQLLREGRCHFSLPESLFDQDYPGHFFRRIKGVLISIPSVTGPYGGVHAKLTLTSSQIRRRATVSPEGDGAGILLDPVAVQSIVTSSGQNDSGMFQLDFRSDRYVPFEGAGACSSWHLELNPLDNEFDTRTISDVVVHLQYTAREGGELLRSVARERAQQSERHRYLSARQDLVDAWHAFQLGPVSGDRSLALGSLAARFFSNGLGVGYTVSKVIVVAVASEGFGSGSPSGTANVTFGGITSPPNVNFSPTIGSLSLGTSRAASLESSADVFVNSETATLTLNAANLDKVEDLLVIVLYSRHAAEGTE